MRLRNNSNYGIRGNNVVGLTIADSVNNVTNGTSDLTGTVSVTSTDMSGGYFTNFMVDNAAGTLNATLDRVDSGVISIAGGDDAIQFEGLNSSTMNVTAQNGTINSAAGEFFRYIGNGSGAGSTCL